MGGYSMYSEVNYSIEALKEYHKAEGVYDIAKSADLLATALENLLLKISERDVEITNIIQNYFNESKDIE